MKKHFQAFIGAFCLCIPVVGQSQDLVQDCQERLMEAETNPRDSKLYSQCGFDNEQIAFGTWLSWAQENNAYQALFEIANRHPQNLDSEKIMLQAVEANNGSALILQGDKFYYSEKDFPQAITSYAKALKAKNLTEEEKGHIGEKIGLLYLNPESSYYNATKGLPIIEKATTQRSALANNIMGVYNLFGLEQTTVNEKDAFFNLWRSVLLGCPAAEENLGIYYLFHNKKISKKEAWENMKDKIYSCSVKEKTIEPMPETAIQQTECDCKKIEERMKFIQDSDEYRFVYKDDTQVILKNKADQTFNVKVGTVLPDGNSVQEIRSTAVILANPKKILYLYPSQECLKVCQMKTQAKQIKDKQKSAIKPYHLTFTAKECGDLIYYAEQLVDTTLPFVGKKECGYSGNLQQANELFMAE